MQRLGARCAKALRLESMEGIRTMELTNDQRAVLATLPFRPTGDEEASYATAQAVTEVVPFGADKTRKLLGELVSLGAVETNGDARRKSYRRAMTEEEAWSLDDAADATQHGVDASDDAPAGDAGADAPEAPTVALSELNEDDGVGSVLGAMRAARPMVATEEHDHSPATGTCTVCGKAMTKNGRSWEHDDGDASHKATSAKQRERTATGERPADAPPIYAKGALKVKILDWLRAQAEGESFTATTVAKAVGGQNGSVQFALDAFVSKGEATMVQRAVKEGGREVKHYAAA